LARKDILACKLVSIFLIEMESSKEKIKATIHQITEKGNKTKLSMHF